MLEQIHSLGNRGLDFGFETTLSGKTYVRLLKDLKKGKGYHIHLFFLWISSVKLALERIKLRVQHGGHSIPETVVRRRFDKGLYNFFHFCQPIIDSWVMFDNSGDIPKMIAYEESEKFKILDPRIYNMLLKYKEKK